MTFDDSVGELDDILAWRQSCMESNSYDDYMLPAQSSSSDLPVDEDNITTRATDIVHRQYNVIQDNNLLASRNSLANNNNNPLEKNEEPNDTNANGIVSMNESYITRNEDTKPNIDDITAEKAKLFNYIHEQAGCMLPQLMAFLKEQEIEEAKAVIEAEAARIAEEMRIVKKAANAKAVADAKAARIAEEMRTVKEAARAKAVAEAEAVRIAEEERLARKAAKLVRIADEMRIAKEAAKAKAVVEGEAARIAEEERLEREAAKAVRIAEEMRLAEKAAKAKAARYATYLAKAAEEAAAARRAQEVAKEVEEAQIAGDVRHTNTSSLYEKYCKSQKSSIKASIKANKIKSHDEGVSNGSPRKVTTSENNAISLDNSQEIGTLLHKVDIIEGSAILPPKESGVKAKVVIRLIEKYSKCLPNSIASLNISEEDNFVDDENEESNTSTSTAAELTNIVDIASPNYQEKVIDLLKFLKENETKDIFATPVAKTSTLYEKYSKSRKPNRNKILIKERHTENSKETKSVDKVSSMSNETVSPADCRQMKTELNTQENESNKPSMMPLANNEVKASVVVHLLDKHTWPFVNKVDEVIKASNKSVNAEKRATMLKVDDQKAKTSSLYKKYSMRKISSMTNMKVYPTEEDNDLPCMKPDVNLGECEDSFDHSPFTSNVEENTNPFEVILLMHKKQKKCKCSKKKVFKSVCLLSKKEIAMILKDQGQIEANCHTCGSVYKMSGEEIDACKL